MPTGQGTAGQGRGLTAQTLRRGQPVLQGTVEAPRVTGRWAAVIRHGGTSLGSAAEEGTHGTFTTNDNSTAAVEVGDRLVIDYGGANGTDLETITFNKDVAAGAGNLDAIAAQINQQA